jgi:hypothetical protein
MRPNGSWRVNGRPHACIYGHMIENVSQIRKFAKPAATEGEHDVGLHSCNGPHRYSGKYCAVSIVLVPEQRLSEKREWPSP